MERRTLGNGSLEVSGLGLGCMRMSFGDTAVDRAEMATLDR
jgi:aryl-alcohol dehydrogenase-like predicted oxidoreductase